MSAVDILPTEDPLETQWISLAHEIAADIHPLGDIISRHRLTQTEFERIQRLPRFQELLQSKILEWNSAGNTAERLKAKFGASLELSAQHLHNLLNDAETSTKDKIELARFMSRVAGVGEGRSAGDGGQASSPFRLTIQISGKQTVIEGAAEPVNTIEVD